MSTDITTWHVGDRAYISGHPTAGALSHGDIVRVVRVDDDGLPRAGNGYALHDYYRKPLRILTPGEVVPAGARLLRIPSHGLASEWEHPDSWKVVSGGNLYAIIAMPEPSPEDVKRDEILTRLDAVQAEVEALRSEVAG